MMVFKRIFAYLIDMFIILIVSSILSSTFPNNNKISELSLETEPLLQNILFNTDEDKTNEEIAEESKKLKDLNYDIEKLSIYTTLTTSALYLLYFIVFQGYNNGQTIGKKLLKIEIVNDSDKGDISFKQLLIREIILYPIIINFVNVILILCLNKALYQNISSVLNLLYYAIFLICFVTMFTKKGSIHDRMSKTVVVNIGESNDQEEGNATKWEKTSTKEDKVRQYKKNHTSGKRKE